MDRESDVVSGPTSSQPVQSRARAPNADTGPEGDRLHA